MGADHADAYKELLKINGRPRTILFPPARAHTNDTTPSLTRTEVAVESLLSALEPVLAAVQLRVGSVSASVDLILVRGSDGV